MESAYKEAQGQPNAGHSGLNGVENYDDLIIPELEEFEPNVRRPWTEIELAILRKYYKPGMARKISEYFTKNFPPGRTREAVERKAAKEGLTGRR